MLYAFLCFILLEFIMLYWNQAGLYSNNLAVLISGHIEINCICCFFVLFCFSCRMCRAVKNNMVLVQELDLCQILFIISDVFRTTEDKVQYRVLSLLLYILWQLIMRTKWTSWRKCSAAKLCPARTQRRSWYWMERMTESVCYKKRSWTAWVVSQHTDASINPTSAPNLLEH